MLAQLDKPASAAELCEALQISQPTLARLIKNLNKEIVTLGQARSRRYLLRRQYEDMPGELPIYQVLVADDVYAYELSNCGAEL